MTEQTGIVRIDSGTLGGSLVPSEDVIARATALAKPLGQMILDRKLYTEISGKKYVRVEGWTTLGAMLGCLPREDCCEKLENGYEATVSIIRAKDGVVVGRASAICLRSEKRWAKADEYAIRSMAITRATGKAFRLGFSWIIKLAGDYEPTPAEEMVIEGEAIEVPGDAAAAEAKSAVPGPQSAALWPAAILGNLRNWLIEAKVLPSDVANRHLHAFLNLTPFGPDVNAQDLLGWSRLYRAGRSEGLAADRAATAATEAWNKLVKQDKPRT